MKVMDAYRLLCGHTWKIKMNLEDTVAVKDPTRGTGVFHVIHVADNLQFSYFPFAMVKTLGFRNEEGYGYENALFSGLKALYWKC